MTLFNDEEPTFARWIQKCPARGSDTHSIDDPILIAGIQKQIVVQGVTVT